METDPASRHMEFVNLRYAEGLQDFGVTLLPVVSAATYTVARLDEPEPPGGVRTAIISVLTLDWLRQCCPHLLRDYPRLVSPEGSSRAIGQRLTATFGLG